MMPNEYQLAAIRTECNQFKSKNRINGTDSYVADVPFIRYERDMDPIRLNHAIMGLSAEAGELQQLLLKIIYYGKPFTDEMRDKMVEEFGDALWFIAQGLTVLGADMETVMQANLAKLKARFPDKFTEDLSANRDEEKEREAMIEANAEMADALGKKEPFRVFTAKPPVSKDVAEQIREKNLALCSADHHWYNAYSKHCIRCELSLADILSRNEYPTHESKQKDDHMHRFEGTDAINSKCKICGKTLKEIQKERLETTGEPGMITTDKKEPQS